MEVLRSCEEFGPVPVLAHSSVELSGRSDTAIACSFPRRSFSLAKVEAKLDGSSAASLVERTVGQLADIKQLKWIKGEEREKKRLLDSRNNSKSATA